MDWVVGRKGEERDERDEERVRAQSNQYDG